ncbi:hypothetical protein ACFST9_14440 [Hymenobacter monticola]|uniref:Uncharacterized protein n=1 Tax=Hymenobacter monticola TaxID=1705399 RepID=A0ABY4BD50_9BACT|nr:hypothetical protein [Hymenobacter monticola]UOE36689.1 hypothetical protein MTP16_24690 [Hymenobacter monticola]
MNPYSHPSERLLEQLIDNSTALCQVDLKLKALHQGDKTTALAIETELVFARRTERIIWVLMLAGSLSFGYLCHKLYPEWLPTHLAPLQPLFKQL